MKLTVLFLPALVLAGISIASAPGSAQPGAGGQGGEPSVGRTNLSAGDQSFATTAAQSGLSEVQEAKIALARSDRRDIRDFAQRMVTDHTKANNRLSAIARQIGLSLQTAPDEKDRHQAVLLSKETGATFDRHYIQDQRAAHREAVALFTKEGRQGRNPAFKQFAEQTLPTLKGHLQMANALPLSSGAAGQKTR